MGIPSKNERLRFLFGPLARSVRYVQLRLDMMRLSRLNRTSGQTIVAPDGPVVSIATYSKRLSSVYLTIESIARGNVLPSRLLLWLDTPAELANLPDELKRLQGRGLEVKLANGSYGPHKKYYPYVLTRTAEAGRGADGPLVTADDDVLYPREWLGELLHAYRQAPDLVHCFRARIVRLEGSALSPYSTWDLCRSDAPSFLHCAIGVSGVIYPPRFLNALREAGNSFLESCPMADDLWLHVQAIRHGFRVHQIRTKPIHFPIVPGTQQVGLQQQNLHRSGNDEQAKRTYQTADINVLRSETRGVSSSTSR